MKLTLRYKINVAILVTFTLIAVIFTSIQLPFQQRRLHTVMDKIETLLQTLVERDERHIANSIFEEILDGIQIRVQEMIKVKGLLGISVFNASGKLLVSEGELLHTSDLSTVDQETASQGIQIREKVWQGQHTLSYLQEIQVLEEQIGFIQIYYSLADVEREQQLSFMIFGGLLSSILFIMLVVLNLILSKTIIHPITYLRDAMHQMRAGELGGQVRITSRDEIGDLSLTFNEMSTERKQVEGALRKLNEELEQRVIERTAELVKAKETAEIARERAEVANQTKNIFLANMSHELRTPLSAILGYVQILKRRKRLDTFLSDSLNIIQQSGEHLLTLINDILDIAKIEAGRMELSPTTIHLPTFLDGIAGIIRSRAEAKNLLFTFEAMDTLPEGVQADETRLRQVLLNLLGNAVKFTDAGCVTLRAKKLDAGNSILDTGNQHPATSIHFEVEDTGIGISADQLERIFQPFEQVGDMARRAEGTGLGLDISHQLVQLMGGELHVESEPGQGSLFWFEVALPVTEVAAEAAWSTNRVITGYRGSRRKVLVADDVPSNRAVVVDLLDPLGFEVIEAVDGQQAIHLAQETRPDLILMDRWMPVMDGLEAMWQIRQIPELQEVPIIAISASVSEEDQAQSREAGYDAFLPKPVDWPRLAALLKEHLKLEWEYEAGGEQAGKAAQERPAEIERLVPPPKEELAVLFELARLGNMRKIRERAVYLEQLDEKFRPFAQKLQKLAKGFQEKAIVAFVEQYIKEGENQ